ncbi:TPA: hypothetical protein U7J60_001324 [Streptococcus agalactiae]|nr:hypothetical protein [Streptococcus agalactiae]HEN7387586.1 hypothetical protein [Streptococcus agalactiae]HEN7388280.1 hypothetical protein [Streptococcus agalactiae]
MTYSYSEYDLNRLNQGKNVYSVNPNYVKQNGGKIITANPKKSNETNLIVTKTGKAFKVLKTSPDDMSGYQGMAVAPIIKGKVDYNSVAVISAATDSSNYKDLIGAVSSAQPHQSSTQLKSADKFLKDVQSHDKWTVTQLSGYSQSAYMLKLGAKYHIPTTVFNGWFRYSTLNEDEKNSWLSILNILLIFDIKRIM